MSQSLSCLSINFNIVVIISLRTSQSNQPGPGRGTFIYRFTYLPILIPLGPMNWMKLSDVVVITFQNSKWKETVDVWCYSSSALHLPSKSHSPFITKVLVSAPLADFRSNSSWKHNRYLLLLRVLKSNKDGASTMPSSWDSDWDSWVVIENIV